MKNNYVKTCFVFINVCIFVCINLKQIKMELLHIDEIDFEKKTLTAIFDGFFQGGFYVETSFDYDELQVEEEDDRTGAIDYFAATNVSFWNFETSDIYEEKFSLNDKAVVNVKQQIENKLIDLLEIELNDN